MPLDYSEVPRFRQLAAILREQIERGELPPGKPIPSKRVIRQMYGVAGSTTDRAVEVLRAEGRVVTVPGLGLYVTDPERWRKD